MEGLFSFLRNPGAHPGCSRRAGFLVAALAAFLLVLISGTLIPGGESSGDQEPAGDFTFTFAFSADSLRIQEEGGYHRLVFPGAEYPDDREHWGMPELPRIPRRAVLPPAEALEELAVLFLEPDTLAGQFLPPPTQPPPGEGEPVDPDPGVYESLVPYPGVAAEARFCGTFRGVRLLDFRLNPFQYIGRTRQLVLYRSIQVRMIRAPLPPLSAGTIRQRQRPGQRWSREQLEVRWLERSVVNPEDFRRLYLGGQGNRVNTELGAFNPTDEPSTSRSPVEMVIITSDNTRLGTPAPGMTAAFQRLADWKTRSGIPTVIRSVEWIQSHYPGIDTQEQIRNFIIDAYEKWSTDWVLLGGDTDIVPARRIINASEPNPPSDLYYAGLDGTMNADGDQWFGEAGEEAQNDPLHDVWLARVPADDSTQAAGFVEKLFDYAQVPGEAGPPPPTQYYRHVLLATGFVNIATWGQPGNGYTWAERIARQTLPASSNVTRLYEWVNADCVDAVNPPCNIKAVSDSVFRAGYPITKWMTTAQLVDSLNGGAHGIGYAYVYHREHSNQYELGGPSLCGAPPGCLNNSTCLHCVESYIAPLTPAAALSLTNAGQLFTIVTSGSISNGFDFHSISEQVLMNPQGGAIAYLGKVRSPSTNSHIVPVNFFTEVFVKGVTRFAQAAGFASESVTSPPPFRTSATWNAMGDPTLPLWTEPPIPLSVSITPSTFSELGVKRFAVNVGVNRDGVLVCLQNDEVYASDFTDDGLQDFVVNLQSPDTLWVTASGANTLPVKTFILFSGTSTTPTVLYQGHAVTDTSSPFSNGNDVVEAGERIRIEVEVKNVGGVTASRVAGTLSAYAPLLFDLEWNPIDTYLGKDGAHPAADADSGFAFPANWFGIRPDDRPDVFTGTGVGGLFVWREFDYPTRPRWRLVARGPHLIPTELPLKGSITTDGAFSDTESWIDKGDTFELASPDSIDLSWVVGNTDVDSLAFRARESAWVTAIRDSATFGPIGTMATVVDTFLIDLDETTPDEHQLVLVLHSADSTGTRVGVSEFAVPVSAPILTHHELDWTRNGIFYTLYPRVKNVGHGRADSVRATLSVFSGTASITDNTVMFGPIAAGAVGYKGPADPFVLKISNVATLKLRITLRNYFANTQTVDWIVEGIDLNRPVPATTVAVEPGFSTMRVLWEAPGVPDLLGANIYRGTTADTTAFVRLNGDPVIGTRVYEDRTTTPGITYYYAVALQDSSGNESAFSEVRNDAATNGQESGWPRRTDGGTTGSPTLGDVDLDGTLEVLMGGLRGLYVWKADGNEFLGGDNNPATNVPFVLLSQEDPDIQFSRGLTGAPAVGDLNGDGIGEIVFTRWEDSLFVYMETGSRAWGRRLDLIHTFGNKGPGWSSPAIGDLAGNSNLEVVVGSWDGLLYAWDAAGNGLLNANGYFAGTGAGFLYQTPALANLNGQGGLEVIIGTGFLGSVKGRVLALKAADTSPANGEADSLWVWNSGANRSFSTPVIGEFGGDTLRVVCTASDRIVMLRGSDGLKTHEVFVPAEQSIATNGGNPTPPALGDVDGDGELEVVVGAAVPPGQFPQPIENRMVRFYVWDPFAVPATFTVLQDSIPVSPLGDNSVLSGAVIGDVDGDGRVEMVFGSANFGVFIWEYASGSFRSDRSWPAVLDGELAGHLAVGNIDATDEALELLAADRSGRLHMFGVPKGLSPTIEWSQLGNSPQHHGRYLGGGSITGPGSPVLATALLPGIPNPFNPVTRLQFVVGHQGPAELLVYDPAGRHIRTLFQGVAAPGPHTVEWDGRDSRGVRVGSGVYFVRLETGAAAHTQKLVLLK